MPHAVDDVMQLVPPDLLALHCDYVLHASAGGPPRPGVLRRLVKRARDGAVRYLSPLVAADIVRPTMVSVRMELGVRSAKSANSSGARARGPGGLPRLSE